MTDVSTSTLHDPEIANMLEQLHAWHTKRIAQLKTLVEAQDDVAMVLRDPDGNEVEIAGDARRGFKAAIRVAIEMFSPFPLQIQAVEYADDQEDE